MVEDPSSRAPVLNRVGPPRAGPGRLRFLLRLLALLVLVSAVVNLHWWWRHARAHHRSAAGLTLPAGGAAPDSLALSVEQQRRWTAVHPEDPSARLALARLLFLANRFSEAEEQLRRLQTQQPHRPEIDYWLALVQKEAGRLDAALRSIRQALRLAPRRELFREELAQIYLAQGRSEEAAGIFDACLRQQPDSYAALMGKARAMEQLYEARRPVAIPEIVEPVRKAVLLQPRNPWGVTVLARMSYAYLQQFDAAERLATEAIQLDPGQAEPYLILVEIYLANPTPQGAARAAAWAREGARLDPHRPEPPYLLGRVLLRQNDLPGAIDAFERSTRRQLMPQAVYQLSLAYARTGQMKKAQHYGRLYDSWNQFSERRTLLLALLQHRPDDTALQAQLAELYLSQGAAEPARNWVCKGLQLRPHDATLARLLTRIQAQGRRGAGATDRSTRFEQREGQGAFDHPH